jgi:hypothetical protein
MTPKHHYFPGRMFEFWSSNVSHGIVVLRSNRSPGFSTRIELVWKGVSALSVVSAMHDVELRVAAREEAAAIVSKLPQDASIGREVYWLAARQFSGYVVAAYLELVEDTFEYYEPSTSKVLLGMKLPTNRSAAAK